MTILPMMPYGALALVLATASLVQGCSSSSMLMPNEQAMVANTGPYSGTAWYADLSHKMTSENGE
jgi:hypothetical protein